MGTTRNGAKFLLDTGLLAEINRLVLHPRGLALAVRVSKDGRRAAFCDDLIDHRSDPEGMVMTERLLLEVQKKLKTAPPFCRDRLKMFPPNGIEPMPRDD